MAKSEQKRQKQLAKKRAKEQRKRRQLAQQKQQMASLAGQMQTAAQGEVYGCYASAHLGQGSNSAESGIGTVFIARTSSGGQLAMAAILIDDHCLGVKNAMGRLCSPSEFEEIVDESREVNNLVPISPNCARKLTEQAIEYAASLGFPPHSDYRKVAPIWGDIDASRCETEFTFGRDGKPCYFAGPLDDPARQQAIFRTLCKTVGEGNFNFVLTSPGGPFGGDWEAIEEDEMPHHDDPPRARFLDE